MIIDRDRPSDRLSARQFSIRCFATPYLVTYDGVLIAKFSPSSALARIVSLL
jgi:hypothetical protein